jgi:Spermidine synthase
MVKGKDPFGRKDTARERAPEMDFKRALLSVFLISLSVLAFEVALTRIFSVMLSYHFVFAVVSVAMLGLGAGGLLFKRWGTALPDRAVWISALLFSVALAVSVALILTLPIYASKALAGFRFWVYIGLAAAPFFAAGFTMSGLFQRFAGRSSLLYGADLLGAAAAAFAVVPAMNAFDPVKVVFLSAAISGGGAALLGHPQPRRILPAAGLAVLLTGLFATLILSGTSLTVPISNDPNKDMFQMVADPGAQARIVASRWSSFGRTDLVESPAYPNEMTIFVDGAAGSPMYNIDGILKSADQKMQFQMHSGEFFPFLFLNDEEKQSALVLGPGGGRDVAIALLGGIKNVTAVEVNPDVVKLVREYKDFNGAIYSGRPGVTALVAEGRNYVRATSERFDVIMASIPITKSSRSVEGYALTENNLFTVEAFEDYLNHLTPNGRLIIVVHDDPEIYKLVGIAMRAFAKQGVTEREGMKRLYTVASDMMPALVIQKQPLTAAAADAIHAKLHEIGFDQGALYIPGIAQQTAGPLRMLDQTLLDIANGVPSGTALANVADLDLRPPTDDRPFYYKFERGLPRPFGAFAILMALAALVMVVLLALRPRRTSGSPDTFVGDLRDSPALKAYLALFFALGVGYMLVEIAFFQRLSLYISQPQLALTLLLFSLLLGGGIGSLLTSLLGRTRLRGAATLSLCVTLLIAGLAFFFARVFALGMDPRLSAVIVVLPLGILMGCPFPLALRSLRTHGLERHTAVMWGVNGVASVLGSALAMIIGITWGFTGAALVGAAIYLAVASLFVILAHPALAAFPSTAPSRGPSRQRGAAPASGAKKVGTSHWRASRPDKGRIRP